MSFDLSIYGEFKRAGLRSDIINILIVAKLHHGLPLEHADDLRGIPNEILLDVFGINQARLGEIREVYPYRPRR